MLKWEVRLGQAILFGLLLIENSGSVMAGDYSTMTQMCLDETNTCVPLYKFDSDGHMEIDMRSIPTIQEWMLFNSNSSGSSN